MDHVEVEDRILETLVDHGIVVESQEVNEVRVAPDVRREVQEREKSEELGHQCTPQRGMHDLCDRWARHRVASITATLRSRDTGLSPEERAMATPMLNLLISGVKLRQGDPAMFVPVDGRQLRVFFCAIDDFLLYVWKDDCPPCDQMRDDLSGHEFDGRSVPYLSIYTDTGVEELTKLDVEGVPAILYVREHSVESRLYGAQYPKAMQREFENVFE